MNETNGRKKVLWVVIAIILLNSIGMTIVFPLLPFLLGEYLPESQIVVGMSALMSVFAACTFLAAPIFGALSDRFGRKNILIISLIGSVVGYVLFGIGGSLWVLFLSRIIDGLTAGNISTIFAYISDVTKPEERTKWFSYIGAAIGVGFMIGPALGGWLGAISISLPFYITAALIFVSIICVYVLLPESLAVEKRTKDFSLKSVNTWAHFKDVFTIKDVRILLILGAFFFVGLGIYQFNFSILMKDVYNWGPGPIGSLLTLVGVCDILSRAVLLPLALKKFTERTTGIVGLIGLCCGFGLMLSGIYVQNVAIIISAVILITLGEGLFDPSYNGNLSKSVDDSNQGKLQGVNQALQSAYRVLVPLGAAAIYVYSPGLLYALATLVVLGALLIFSNLKSKAV